ncbi:hypothetical protein MAE02_45740 [Microvirga aerophila]|uniref:Uncharacterized protein n=1 Tax=Microvirga aerophila TaxID=670291 RepID=A0A512BY46_9HYPH|nr:hypothetical protein MAE02_45740 [Microvirga aerophila]
MSLISVFSLWFGFLGVAIFMRHLNTRDHSQQPDQAVEYTGLPTQNQAAFERRSRLLSSLQDSTADAPSA